MSIMGRAWETRKEANQTYTMMALFYVTGKWNRDSLISKSSKFMRWMYFAWRVHRGNTVQYYFLSSSLLLFVPCSRRNMAGTQCGSAGGDLGKWMEQALFLESSFNFSQSTSKIHLNKSGQICWDFGSNWLSSFPDLEVRIALHAMFPWLILDGPRQCEFIWTHSFFIFCAASIALFGMLGLASQVMLIYYAFDLTRRYVHSSITSVKLGRSIDRSSYKHIYIQLTLFIWNGV